MRKSFISDSIKVVVGLIIWYPITWVIHWIEGYILFNTMKFSWVRELITVYCVQFIFDYLPFLLLALILGIMIYKDYSGGDKNDIIWKVILLALFYVTFEFRLVVKLINYFI